MCRFVSAAFFPLLLWVGLPAHCRSCSPASAVSPGTRCLGRCSAWCLPGGLLAFAGWPSALVVCVSSLRDFVRTGSRLSPSVPLVFRPPCSRASTGSALPGRASCRRMLCQHGHALALRPSFLYFRSHVLRCPPPLAAAHVQRRARFPPALVPISTRRGARMRAAAQGKFFQSRIVFIFALLLFDLILTIIFVCVLVFISVLVLVYVSIFVLIQQ